MEHFLKKLFAISMLQLLYSGDTKYLNLSVFLFHATNIFFKIIFTKVYEACLKL